MGWKMANFFGFVLFFCCLKCFPIWFWRFKRKWHARWWRGRHSSSCGYHHAWSTQASNSQQHTPSARSQVIFFGYILHFILPSLNDIWEDRRRRPRMSFYYEMYIIIILSGGAAAAETHCGPPTDSSSSSSTFFNFNHFDTPQRNICWIEFGEYI